MAKGNLRERGGGVGIFLNVMDQGDGHREEGACSSADLFLHHFHFLFHCYNTFSLIFIAQLLTTMIVLRVGHDLALFWKGVVR